MTPYYDDGTCTIYLGDCREILPTITADVLVTDPPYGIEIGTSTDRRRDHKLVKGSYDSFADTYEHFVEKIVPAINMALDRCRRGAVFSGPHIHEQRKPDAIGGVYLPTAVARHTWGFKSFLPVLFYGQAPALNRGSKATAIRSVEQCHSDSEHPCAKPLGFMRWLVDLASLTGDVVLDPFMGSGTTLRAAKDLGRKAIGIEISERYCEIAARRLGQGVLNLGGGTP